MWVHDVVCQELMLSRDDAIRAKHTNSGVIAELEAEVKTLRQQVCGCLMLFSLSIACWKHILLVCLARLFNDMAMLVHTTYMHACTNSNITWCSH